MQSPVIALAASLLLAGCAGLASPQQGPVQPQSVEGPCRVQSFFLLSQTAVHTTMTLPPPGGTCAFTLINPDLQAFPTAALVTQAAGHGRATAGLTNGGRSALITYTPLAGAAGADRFTVTIEPDDHAVEVAVIP